MSTITVNDLNDNRAMSAADLATVNGGWYWLYQPVFSYWSNPYAYMAQSSWASRAQMMDSQHNSFIDFIRS